MALILFFPLMMLSFFSISALPHSLNNISQQQQYSLLQFKAAITNNNNNSLPDWTPLHPFFNWTGVTCHPSSHSVVALNLSFMNLEGTISSLLTNLSCLQSLDLSSNALTGTIPPQLGQLPLLQILWIYKNQLQGPIPPELGMLTHLQELHISEN
ncbi:hypothetical protein SUGI_0305320 [Cryptomeria japonica]|nr:hypothetical protein SUGI_0305320 [Cryptomeria japonica]